MRHCPHTFLLVLFCLARLARAEDAAPYTLQPGSFGVSWDQAGLDRPWGVGEARSVSVTVRNLGLHAWPNRAAAHPAGDGRYAVRLSYCWRAEGGGEPTDDCWRSRVELPETVPPGAQITVPFTMTAPARPGRFEIELDLLQELVSWFRGKGAQTLVVPALVLAPPPAPSTRGQALLRVVTALAAAVSLLFVVGFGFVPFIAPPRLAPATALLAPIVGLSVLSAAGHALAYAPVGTDVTLWPIVGACVVLDVVAWRRGARLRFPRRHLPIWLVFVGALALTSFPLVALGDLTALGGEIDNVIYVARGDWMRGHGMLVRPAASPSDDFVAAITGEPIRNGLRQGDQYVLAALGSLLGLRAYRVFSILQSVFHAVAPLGVFALARYGLRFPNRAATLAGALTAVQPLAHYVALNSFMSQNSGLAVFPFVVLAVLAALRATGRRGLLLAALFVGALATFYTVYVVYLVPVLALAALAEWLAGVRARSASGLGRVVGRLVAIAIASVVLFPVGWRHGLVGLRAIGLITSGTVGAVSTHGNVVVYPHVGEIFGIVGHANAAHQLHLPEVGGVLATALAGVALLAFSWGVAVASSRARWLLGGVWVVAIGAAAHQRLGLGEGNGFPYGYFKVVSLFAPFLLIGVANGCAWWWRSRVVAGPAQKVLRWTAGATLPAVLVGLSLFNDWNQTPLLAYRYLAADGPIVGLDGAGMVLPPMEGLVVADRRWPGRAWTLYMLDHGRAFDRVQPAPPGLPPEGRSRRLLRYALVAEGEDLSWTPGEPWGRPEQREVLWSGPRFSLLRRTDGALADLRFTHPDCRVGLAHPVRIEVGRLLALSGPAVPNGRFEQQLDWSPQSLEIALSVPHGGRLRLADGDRSSERVLPPGAQSILVPATARLDLELLPSDADARLWGVKALPDPVR